LAKVQQRVQCGSASNGEQDDTPGLGLLSGKIARKQCGEDGDSDRAGGRVSKGAVSRKVIGRTEKCTDEVNIREGTREDHPNGNGPTALWKESSRKSQRGKRMGRDVHG
jgi:hypothetical protein